jgi:heme oxygenase (biliverdin-IX-beta and delta-forming)
MRMLNKLREETEILHREIEKDNLAALIISHEISLGEYKLLLLQNYIAYAVTENEISSHLSHFEPVKSVQLLKDLENLQISIPPFEKYYADFIITNEAEAYGAAYVVEGSAMGGMLIAKELEHCPALSGIEEHFFFNGKRQNVNGWKAFTKSLKKKEFSEREEILAVNKAKETFRIFARIFDDAGLKNNNSFLYN